jgi:predicted TIM-barrel fold metal-dependent hydrolase
MDDGAQDYGDWLISVDDHVIEPPHVWLTHLPAKYRDRAPRVIHDPEDSFWKWTFEGRPHVISGLSGVAGLPSSVWEPLPMNLEEPPFAAFHDPVARAEAMNEDHVIASLLFGTFTGFCGRTFLEAEDKELALACIQAYNDWMIDEWAAAAPGRFIPLALAPLWDGELAAAEARRVAAKGAKSISFTENPYSMGLPSLHDQDRPWDPLFRACVEHGLPLSIHIGSSGRQRLSSPDAPLIEGASFLAIAPLETTVDWIWSGNLLRYPELKIVLSESGISWLPSLIERMRRDQRRWRWVRDSDTTFQGDVLTGDPRPRGARSPFGDIPAGFDPIDTYHQSIFPSVITDDYGWEAIDYLGIDNILVETDYPHGDSAFPHSAKTIAENIRHLPADQQAKLLRENACRVYDFTPAPAASLPTA